MRAHCELLRNCMGRRVEILNKQMIGKMPIWPSCKGPTRRAALFGKLVSHGLRRELPKRGQLGAPHVLVIATRHRFESITGSSKAVQGVGSLLEVSALLLQ